MGSRGAFFAWRAPILNTLKVLWGDQSIRSTVRYLLRCYSRTLRSIWGRCWTKKWCKGSNSWPSYAYVFYKTCSCVSWQDKTLNHYLRRTKRVSCTTVRCILHRENSLHTENEKFLKQFCDRGSKVFQCWEQGNHLVTWVRQVVRGAHWWPALGCTSF